MKTEKGELEDGQKLFELFLSQSKTDYDVHFLLSDLYLDQVQKNSI